MADPVVSSLVEAGHGIRQAQLQAQEASRQVAAQIRGPQPPPPAQAAAEQPPPPAP